MSSTKKLSAEKYSAMPFFRFTLRHNLQHLALYLVIAVLLMILPTMILIDDFADRMTRYGDWDYVSAVASDILLVSGLGVLVSGGIALLAGMSTCSYVNSKTSVGCYHSFPLKREVILGCESLTRVIYFAVTMIFGYAVSYIIMLAGLPAEGVTAGAGDYWLLALASVFVFLVVYSLMLFAGGLTGNGVTRLLMAALIVCLPTALYALVVTLAGIGCSDLYDGYYLNEDILTKIFVPVRGYYGIYDLLEYGRIGGLLTTLIDTAFYTVGAFLLQKYRRSEHSGTSIIWKPVFVIVRLAVIVVCALFGGWFFSAAMGLDRNISLFIGAVIGGVTAFIAANCILYRSSRAMFRGLKSFGITMAAIFVFIVFIPMNAAGLIGRFYSASATDSFTVRMTQYGSEVVYDDPEDIELIYSLLTDERNMFSGESYPAHPVFNTAVHTAAKCLDPDYKWTNQGAYTDSGVKGVFLNEGSLGPETRSVYVIQKPKFGMPLAKIVSADVNSVFTDTVTASEEFAQAMNIAAKIDIDDVCEAEIRLDKRSLYVYDGINGPLQQCSYDDGVEHNSFEWINIRGSLADIISKASYRSEFRENSPVVGQIVINYYIDDMLSTNVYANRAGIELPVYACDLDLINAIDFAMTQAQCELDNVYVDYDPIDTTEEYYERALDRAGANEAIFLADCTTGAYCEISRDTLISLADDTSSFVSGSEYYTRSFEIIGSSRYMIIYSLENDEDIELRFRRGTDADEKLGAIIEENTR